MPASPTEVLAQFAAGLSLDAVPAAVTGHARLSILDTLGCAVHGAGLPWCRIARELARAEGCAEQATVLGTDLRSSSRQAGWLNATAGHGFEYDDVHMGGMIHPGSLTLSAALAAGEQVKASGADLLAAVIAGCETGARVGRAVGTRHFAVGFHPQGTVGVFAAAASAGRVLGLDPARMRQALGIAGSHASGLMAAQRGAMVKRLHSGHACQSGIVAAQLAARGFTGIPDVLEADFGGFCSAMGGGSVDLSQLTAELGTRWETAAIGFKPYPSCAAAQSSIEAARLLRDRDGLRPADIAAVTIKTSTHTQVHCGWPYEPAGVTAAQMSIPYGVARILADGRLSAAQFTEEAIADPPTLALAARVSVVADEELDRLGPARRYAVRASIRTMAGAELTIEVDDRPGNTSTPLSRQQLDDKFTGLAAPVLGPAAASDLMSLVDRLEQLADVRELAAAASLG
jgi:2-methylcitrate dehydratase PrpD